jgi:ubiquinone/menaquinone biosynthesis C-methylase UbiE
MAVAACETRAERARSDRERGAKLAAECRIRPAEVGRLGRRFVRSRRLSFFERGADVFLHHDQTGDILRMDRSLIDFLDYFVEPRTHEEAHEKFDGRFPKHDVDQFLDILPEHRCLVLEGTDEEEALDEWCPVRGPWTLVYAPSSGEVEVGWVDRSRDEVVIERLSPLEARVLKLCDGERTIKAVWEELAKEMKDVPDLPAKVRATVFRFTHSDRQILKLAYEAESAYDAPGRRRPPYLDSTMPYARLGSASPEAPSDVASTREYHRTAIKDAQDQFEVRETTLSHAFREPHPALGGKTYGGRLAKVLIERDMVPEEGKGPLRVVEVGGGTGIFAQSLIDGIAVASPRVYHRLKYSIIDIAPELQRSQRDLTRPHGEKVRLVRGDAAKLPLASGSVDLLIANEMIADLETAETTRTLLSDSGSRSTAIDAVRKFKLPWEDAPETFWVNAGACAFVEEVARVLRPGGRAILTEFGERDRYPVESTHLDHREFSIHFGHLKAAAESVGLAARIESVPDLIEIDGRVQVLTTNKSFFLALRALFARGNVALQKIAYTPDALRALAATAKIELDKIEGLIFSPCGERTLGLKPREFKALLLERPAGAVAPRGPQRRVSLDI